MKNRDVRLGVVLIAIFIFLFAYSFTFQKSDVMSTHTTAAFFPRVVLVVAVFFTLLMIVQNIRKGADDSKMPKLNKEKLKRVLASMGLAILFGLGTAYLGTLVSSSLFIIGIMVTWGVNNKLTIGLNALITPILIYLVFTMILEVQLPAGILK